MQSCVNLDEVSEILYKEYVSDRSFSIIDRMSRVTHKDTAIQILYDAIRGIKDDKRKEKFKEFVDEVSKMLETNSSEAISCIKLLALKAISR